jgi:hypothetical protein
MLQQDDLVGDPFFQNPLVQTQTKI